MGTTKMNQQENLTQKEVYEKPVIEMIEMETEGSILQGSDFAPGGGRGW